MDENIDTVLHELEQQERFEQENPDAVPGREKMLAITRDIGLFYNILLRSNDTKKVLEIGTSTGYSTIWFADAIIGRQDAKITTIEQEEKKIARAQENFTRTGFDGIINIMQGTAIDVLRKLDSKEEFDFVFIDADKENVIEYFDLALCMIRPGGIIGIDNVLKPERFSVYMRPLTDHVRSLSNVRAVLVPIDNGELLCTKLG